MSKIKPPADRGWFWIRGSSYVSRHTLSINIIFVWVCLRSLLLLSEWAWFDDSAEGSLMCECSPLWQQPDRQRVTLCFLDLNLPTSRYTFQFLPLDGLGCVRLQLKFPHQSPLNAHEEPHTRPRRQKRQSHRYFVKALKEVQKIEFNWFWEEGLEAYWNMCDPLEQQPAKKHTRHQHPLPHEPHFWGADNQNIQGWPLCEHWYPDCDREGPEVLVEVEGINYWKAELFIH